MITERQRCGVALDMKSKFESIVVAAVVACTVVTTGLVVRREFFTPAATSAAAEQKPTMIPHWQNYLTTGDRIGPTQAKVKLIEFADFECPFCDSFHKSFKKVRGRYPNEVSLDYVHLPLPIHRFAIPAARAAECANDQGRFEAMHDQLFEGQDQFGLKSWDDYATAAGVPDLVSFDACIRKSDSIPRVEEGKALGAKLDVQATPTIIINGWKLGHPPSEQELDQMVQRILAGKSPVDGKS
jgi:protein-disulfide isomerase